MVEETINLNPQIADSEPSSYNPDLGNSGLDVFRQVDEANYEPQPSEEPVSEVPQGNEPQETPQEVQQTPQQLPPEIQQAQNPQTDLSQNEPTPRPTPNFNFNNVNFRQEAASQEDEIKGIVDEARKVSEENATYRRFFASPKGQALLRQLDEEEIARQSQGAQNPSDPETNFRKRASDVLGIEEDNPFYQSLDEKISAKINASVSEDRQFIQQMREAQENANRQTMAMSFANHLIKTYDMPEDVARQAAFKGMTDATKALGKYNQSAYWDYLNAFEAKHIAPVGISIMKSQLEEARNKAVAPTPQPQPAPSVNVNSSTAYAADRMMNANYKSAGNIPTGGNIGQTQYDEGDDVRGFVEFANSHYRK